LSWGNVTVPLFAPRARRLRVCSSWITQDSRYLISTIFASITPHFGHLNDRMPVILAEPDWAKWLGEETVTEQELLALLRLCPDEALKIWPVDNKVGNVRNTGPQLMRPL
jgi:putative SOS response-associated peptidase YedK